MKRYSIIYDILDGNVVNVERKRERERERERVLSVCTFDVYRVVCKLICVRPSVFLSICVSVCLIDCIWVCSFAYISDGMSVYLIVHLNSSPFMYVMTKTLRWLILTFGHMRKVTHAHFSAHVRHECGLKACLAY